MTTTEIKQTSISIVILSDNHTAAEHLETELSRIDHSISWNITLADFTAVHSVHADFVLMEITNNSNIMFFIQATDYLKNEAQIPHVITIVEGREAINEVTKLAALFYSDEFLYAPYGIEELSKIIKTHAVSLIIANQLNAGASPDSERRVTLGQLLVENGIITNDQLMRALDHQKKNSGLLGDILVELQIIDEEQKVHFLGSQMNIPVATPRQYASADMNVVALIPELIARQHTCLAIKKKEDVVSVVMTDAQNLPLLDTLRDTVGFQIRPYLGTVKDITTSIERYYNDISSQKDASMLMGEMDESMEFVKEEEGNVNLDDMKTQGAEVGIVKLVNILVGNAVRDKASDIHIEPMDKELIIRYRIDGDLRKVMSPPKKSHAAIITRLKILSNLDIAERRLPQDGRMIVKFGNREVDIRVSILPTIFGEKAVLRVLDKEAFEKSMLNLGFTGYEEKIFDSQIRKPYGMIIVTGPTGSGKSTTLYSAVQAIRSVKKNIITVEDPVEFHMDKVTQVHVNTRIGLTFASALRSILRQDPDVILIGEIRDAETADIAIKMALTGHLVFSTLHTNDAASSIARFVDIGIPPLLLGSSLNLIVAQRLLRTICTNCRSTYEAEPELLQSLNMDPATPRTFYRGEGCVVCNGTGYKGRKGIFEMLPVSREIRTMILRNATTVQIQDQAEKEGMRTLRQSAIELALAGFTTVEEVLAATMEI